MPPTKHLTLLTAAAFAASLTACAPAQTCRQEKGPAFSLCRNEEIAATPPKRITAAILIGAPLGAPFAAALRGDATVVANGSLMQAGGPQATQQYWTYRLNQAHNDRDDALNDVYKDIKQDLDTANDQQDFAHQTNALLALALGSPSETPSQKAADIVKGQKLADITGKSADALTRAAQVYAHLPDVTRQPFPTRETDRLKQIDQAVRQIEASHASMVQMIAPPSRNGGNQRGK
jgi:hypothetical protein